MHMHGTDAATNSNAMLLHALRSCLFVLLHQTASLLLGHRGTRVCFLEIQKVMSTYRNLLHPMLCIQDWSCSADDIMYMQISVYHTVHDWQWLLRCAGMTLRLALMTS